jgi:hypothetical protein
LREITGIRRETFKQPTIRDAFKKRGLYSFDPEEVMKPLRDTKDPNPDIEMITTPPPPPPPSSSSPPSTIRGLRRSISKAQDFIQDNPDLDQSFIQRLDRVFQSSPETSGLAGQLRGDLQQYLRYQRPQFKRKSQRQIRHTGVLTVYDANHRIGDCAQKEREQTLRRVKKMKLQNMTNHCHKQV